MLFRILPVMVWSFTGTLTGTALAIFEGHEIKWLAFLLVLTISALIQGYPTHIVNEIFDWKSGADSYDLRVQKSGGSKVLQARLLSVADLWKAFIISHVALLVLLLACAKLINAEIVLFFMLPGYLSGLLYSLPPFRFSYRPFLGEWLGGFAGMFLLVLGSFYAQSLSIAPVAGLTAFGIGLIYIGIMIFFHYVDIEHDCRALPKKNTTVVFLGLAGSRRYVYGCLVAAALIFLVATVKFHFFLIAFFALSLIILYGHHSANLKHSPSLIKKGKIITYATLVCGLGFAAAAKPIMLLMAFPLAFGFWSHKKFGKLTGLN